MATTTDIKELQDKLASVTSAANSLEVALVRVIDERDAAREERADFQKKIAELQRESEKRIRELGVERDAAREALKGLTEAAEEADGILPTVAESILNNEPYLNQYALLVRAQQLLRPKTVNAAALIRQKGE